MIHTHDTKTIREILSEESSKKDSMVKSKISKVTDLRTDFIGDEIEVSSFGNLKNCINDRPKNYKKRWRKEDILKLYRGILELGYNIELLEIYLNYKWSPKQIKDKIKREEKIRPELIAKAMLGKKNN